MFSIVRFYMYACKNNNFLRKRKHFSDFFKDVRFYNFIQVSQVQKLMKLKELSLPTVAEELRQLSFWRSS